MSMTEVASCRWAVFIAIAISFFAEPLVKRPPPVRIEADIVEEADSLQQALLPDNSPHDGDADVISPDGIDYPLNNTWQEKQQAAGAEGADDALGSQPPAAGKRAAAGDAIVQQGDAIVQQGVESSSSSSDPFTAAAPVDDSGAATSSAALAASEQELLLPRASVAVQICEDATPSSGVANGAHGAGANGALAGANGALAATQPESADATLFATAQQQQRKMQEGVADAPRGLGARLRGVLADSHTTPTAICIALLFALKLVQQGSVSGVPDFAIALFGWTAGEVGMFMAASSLGMIGINFAAAAVTAHVRAPLPVSCPWSRTYLPLGVLGCRIAPLCRRMCGLARRAHH